MPYTTTSYVKTSAKFLVLSIGYSKNVLLYWHHRRIPFRRCPTGTTSSRRTTTKSCSCRSGPGLGWWIPDLESFRVIKSSFSGRSMTLLLNRANYWAQLNPETAENRVTDLRRIGDPTDHPVDGNLDQIDLRPADQVRFRGFEATGNHHRWSSI